MAVRTKKSVFYVRVQAFGLALNVTGIKTPKTEETPVRFNITSIEDRGINIVKYIKAFGLLTEVEELVKEKLTKTP